MEKKEKLGPSLQKNKLKKLSEVKHSCSPCTSKLHVSFVSIIICQSIWQIMDPKYCIDLDCKTETKLSPLNYCWTIGYGPSRKQAEDLCLSSPSLIVWQGEEWPSPYLFHFWVLIDGLFYKWLPQDLSSVKEYIETVCTFLFTLVTYRKCGKTCCICSLCNAPS